MATDNEIKALKAVTARKKEYLKYFKRVGPKKAMTWGKWKQTQAAKAVGGSRQTQGALRHLPPGVFKDVMKMKDKGGK